MGHWQVRWLCGREWGRGGAVGRGGVALALGRPRHMAGCPSGQACGCPRMQPNCRVYRPFCGRDPTEVLADLTGWNVWDLINEANVTVSGLRAVRGCRCRRRALLRCCFGQSAGAVSSVFTCRPAMCSPLAPAQLGLSLTAPSSFHTTGGLPGARHQLLHCHPAQQSGAPLRRH